MGDRKKVGLQFQYQADHRSNFLRETQIGLLRTTPVQIISILSWNSAKRRAQPTVYEGSLQQFDCVRQEVRDHHGDEHDQNGQPTAPVLNQVN